MSEDPQRRLFTAIELLDSWRKAASRFQRVLEPVAGGDLHWVRPELLHITVVFLGYRPEGSLPRIEGALAEAGREVRPFRLAMGKPGCFGQPHNLRVIWVGLATVPEGLERLHRAVSARLSAEGIPFDRKPLVPHITLARARPSLSRDTSLRVHAKLQGLRLDSIPPLDVTDYVLMESHLSRYGPNYQVVRRFPLML